MANLVKPKRVLIIGSSLVIFFITAFRTNYFHSPQKKVWRENNPLVWTDFRGVIPPFTSYAAGISSTIYLDYDSSKNSYFAYAAQNQNRSWTDDDRDYGLRHEQYHFNITEYFARELNEHIQHDTSATHAELESILGDLKYDLRRMQKRYDDETDHSLRKDHQRRWEYKIDSMLTLYEKHQGTFTDYYSGISGMFPTEPDFVIYGDTLNSRTGYWLEKYDMRLRFLTRFDVKNDTSKLENMFASFLGSNGFSNVQSKSEMWGDFFVVETQCRDTVNNVIFYDRIFYKAPYEYQITVFTPDSDPIKDCERIKNEFFNSIEIKPRNNYWIDLYEKNDILNQPMRELDGSGASCMFVYSQSDYSITHHRPFIYKDFILIPFASIRHKFEEIDDIHLIVNDDKLFDQEPDSIHQLLHISTNHLREGNNIFQFGYTLKSDSLEECYKLYSSFSEFKYEKLDYSF